MFRNRFWAHYSVERTGEGQHEAAGSNKSFHFCPESGPSNASGPTLASLMLCPCFTFVKPIASTDWRSGMLHLCFTFASLLLQILSNSLHQLLWSPETFVTSSSSWFDSRPFPFVKLKLFWTNWLLVFGCWVGSIHLECFILLLLPLTRQSIFAFLRKIYFRLQAFLDPGGKFIIREPFWLFWIRCDYLSLHDSQAALSIKKGYTQRRSSTWVRRKLHLW